MSTMQIEELLLTTKVAVQCDTEEELARLCDVMVAVGVPWAESYASRVSYMFAAEPFYINGTPSSNCVTMMFKLGNRPGWVHGTWDEYAEWCRVGGHTPYDGFRPDLCVRMNEYTAEDDSPVEFDAESFDSFLSAFA